MTSASARPQKPAPPRVVIERVSPEIDGGRFPIKRVVGERVCVSATIFAEGHDRLAAHLLFRRSDAPSWQETPFEPLGNDRWQAAFEVDHLAEYQYTLEAWVDPFASWHEGLAKKVAAGQDVTSELLEGAQLLRAGAARAKGGDRRLLAQRAAELEGAGRDAARALAPDLADAMARHPDRSRGTRYERVLDVRVERERARSGAWYEFFPRSCAREPGRHGTLRDCEERLAYAASMGFDVVYLPPIHPIGRSHRKGPNNTPSAAAGDPGSPWAIGAEDGGHKAVHPELGSLADFDRLVARASELGLEIALDVAFQCSPDHPYVAKHPEWFRHRPDGSIQYAENPPKKYQDIYPIEFACENWRELWEELRSVVLFWIEHGVKIFRVDNPHTKPLPFWEWLIQEVRSQHPDVVFLSEAFTRPALLHYLAKVGFSQSYTYFTWRNTKHELVEYLTELWSEPGRDYLRPNLFANTPDILHAFLQTGPRSAFQIRLVLAATLAGSYGIYGPCFELCVSEAVPGTEEYLDSEKYQVRHWDLDAPSSLRDFVTRVNEIRRENPALVRGGAPEFHPVDNDLLLAYTRRGDGDALLLVVVNLDPHHRQSGWLELPLERLGIDADRPFQAHDVLGGGRYFWTGSRNFVSLDPAVSPAHVFRVRRRVATERDFDYYL